MKTYIVLLRGVMPTGKNRVPMPMLRAAMASAGLRDTQTYIQSGNVIARSHLSQAALEMLIYDAIKKHIGADIAVIARPAERFRAILANSPFPRVDPSRLYFSLLASQPDLKLVQDFQATNFAPDQIRIADGVIYSLYATKLSDSKFDNNYFERKLKVTATTRNFNTVTKLIELSSPSPALVD